MEHLICGGLVRYIGNKDDILGKDAAGFHQLLLEPFAPPLMACLLVHKAGEQIAAVLTLHLLLDFLQGAGNLGEALSEI